MPPSNSTVFDYNSLFHATVWVLMMGKEVHNEVKSYMLLGLSIFHS